MKFITVRRLTIKNFLIRFACFAGMLGCALPAQATESAESSNDRGIALARKEVHGGKRIALVIGNGNYQHGSSLPKLANPINDAEDIANELRSFGFEVIEKKNLTKEEMDSAISAFGRKISDSDAALFYFAGHGLQVKGQNYLIPVDARIESEAQVAYNSINVNQLLDEMENARSRTNIVMLDACRNNPLTGRFRSGNSRGLAAPSSMPKGTVIVYATDPGGVAADGTGRNGLFTAGLLTAFQGSDLSLNGVLIRASEVVELASSHRQTPYINGPATLQKNFQFARNQVQTGSDTGVVDAPPAHAVREDAENVLWAEVEKGNSKDDYDDYLTQYPTGKYSAIAKRRIKKMQDGVAVRARLKQEEESVRDRQKQETEEAAAKQKQETEEAAARQKQAEDEARAKRERDAEYLSSKAREKQKRIDDFSYFRVFSSTLKDMEKDPVSSITTIPYLPISLVFDIISLPKNSTELNKIKNEAAYRPATWGKADSMIARASLERHTLGTTAGL